MGLTIRLPYGSGLLVFNYTLTVKVLNAPENPINTAWSFETRKKATSLDTDYTIVDANRTVPGFTLEVLPHMAYELGGTGRRSDVYQTWIVCLSMLWIAGAVGNWARGYGE